MATRPTFVRVEDRVTELVETATGERYSVRRKRAPAQSFGRRFVVLFDDTMHDLAAHLSAYSLKVLVALPKRLDWRSWRRMPQADLATHLGMSKSRVCRALHELEQHGVLHSRGKGAAVEWRMSRVLGYRGRAAQYHRDGQEEACERLEDVQVDDVPAPVVAIQPELPLRTPKLVFGRPHRAAAGLH